MPVIQITLLEGRSAEVKRRIAERVTDVIVEEAGPNRDGVVVTFVEVSTESYARGGVMMKERLQAKK